MIKSVITDGIEIHKAVYPILKVTYRGLVVLFTAPSAGMVIKAIDPDFSPIGTFRQNWAEEDCFYPLIGTIKLSNK